MSAVLVFLATIALIAGTGFWADHAFPPSQTLQVRAGTNPEGWLPRRQVLYQAAVIYAVIWITVMVFNRHDPEAWMPITSIGSLGSLLLHFIWLGVARAGLRRMG